MREGVEGRRGREGRREENNRNRGFYIVENK